MTAIQIAMPSARASIALLALGIGVPCVILVIAMLASGKVGRPALMAILALAVIPTLFILWKILARQAIYVDAASLTVNTAFYRQSVALQNIERPVVFVDLRNRPELRPALRLNGIGLPGYQGGWFRLKDGSKAFLALTRDSAVLLHTNSGYSLLVSPEESEARRLAALLNHESETQKK